MILAFSGTAEEAIGPDYRQAIAQGAQSNRQADANKYAPGKIAKVGQAACNDDQIDEQVGQIDQRRSQLPQIFGNSSMKTVRPQLFQRGQGRMQDLSA